MEFDPKILEVLNFKSDFFKWRFIFSQTSKIKHIWVLWNTNMVSEKWKKLFGYIRMKKLLAILGGNEPKLTKKNILPLTIVQLIGTGR